VTLPGRRKVSTGAPGLAVAVITEGGASSCVLLASTVSADLRLKTPQTPSPNGYDEDQDDADESFAGRDGFLFGRGREVVSGVTGWLRVVTGSLVIA
jgi:hypothetical protein